MAGRNAGSCTRSSVQLVKNRIERPLQKGEVSEMASSWYHAFEAQMSWEVVGLVIALLALAYLIGRKAVQ